MIEVKEKTENNISLYISQDESVTKTIGIILSLLQKGFKLYEYSEHTRIYTFKRAYIDKMLSIYSTLKFNSSIDRVTLHKQSYSSNMSIMINVLKTESELKEINYLKMFSSHLNNIICPTHTIIKAEIWFDIVKIIEKSQYINSILTYISNMEENNNLICLLMQLTNLFSESTDPRARSIKQISASAFTRLANYKISFKKPSEEALTRFINLCSYFEKNPKVTEFKYNQILKLTQSGNNSISIYLCKLNIFEDMHIEKYKYLEHPALNFVANLLEENNLLNSFELNLSKQIILNT